MSCVVTLKQKGLRLTPQRRLIMELFHDSGEHLTTEAIISHVQSKMPGVNKSTVYRTLDLLEEAGCVYKSTLEGQLIYHHADEGHHHHLVCRKCGKTTAYGEDLFAPVSQALRESHGFHVHFTHMVISGLCEQCAGEES